MRYLLLLSILLASCACSIPQEGSTWTLSTSGLSGPEVSECAAVQSISLSRPDPITISANLTYGEGPQCSVAMLQWTLDGAECWGNSRCWEPRENGSNLTLRLAPDAGSGIAKACANNVCAEVTI